MGPALSCGAECRSYTTRHSLRQRNSFGVDLHEHRARSELAGTVKCPSSTIGVRIRREEQRAAGAAGIERPATGRYNAAFFGAARRMPVRSSRPFLAALLAAALCLA